MKAQQPLLVGNTHSWLLRFSLFIVYNNIWYINIVLLVHEVKES